MRPRLIAGAVLIGCVATHEPRVPPVASIEPLDVSVRVVVDTTQFPDIDFSLCEMAVADLRRAGFFKTVFDCGSSVPADLTTRAQWQTTRAFDDWCRGDRSIGLALATAGVISACSCPSSYVLEFRASEDGPIEEVRLDREACTLVGWVPLFLNLREDYHWRGPANPSLRAERLKGQLAGSRLALQSLVSP